MRKLLILPATLALVTACTWGIKLDPGGQRVRTAWNGDVGGCQDMGKVTVSVLDHVGPVDRNDIKVRDELEVMARNQAADMGADTIRPIGDPEDGEQSWTAYRCGANTPNAVPAPPAPAATPADTPAQTFPASAATGQARPYPTGNGG